VRATQLSAEQLHDDGGAQHEDNLNQPLRRKDPVERRHLALPAISMATV
jgi:hypothetical protein